MNRRLAGRLLWSMTERLCGRDTMRRLHLLQQTDRLSADALRDLQNSRLRRLLKLANAHCPFYARRFRSVGLDADDPSITVDDLRLLPMLSRDDVREHILELTWSSPAPLPFGPPVPHNTGGSTGEPLKFYIDRARQAADWAARWRARGWWSVQPGDRELLLWGAPPRIQGHERLRRWRDRLLNQTVLSAFEMTDAKMDDYLKRMIRLQPACLYGYATSLATLARHELDRMGPKLQGAVPGLRAVFVTGETLLDHDRQLVETAFGAPVANEYGARDAGLLALQCPSGSLHVPSENVIIELIDAGHGNAVPVEEGATGEVVVTYLENFVMPFIRYRVGDLARRPLSAESRCSCGRAHDVLAEVQGRLTDQIVTRRDGRLNRMHALSLIYALREADGIHQFRILQPSLEVLTIEVVADARFTPDQQQRVTTQLHERIGAHVAIHFQHRAHIEAGPAGKHACVISHVA